MESMQIYQKCLNDIQMDFTERLTHLRGKYEEVSRNENVKFSKQLNSLVLFQVHKKTELMAEYLKSYGDKLEPDDYANYIKQR